jgi:hypothetical protein
MLVQQQSCHELTKKVGPFDDANLASHILCKCPRRWQVQYKLTKDMVPQSIWMLLEVLECIEKAFPTDYKQSNMKKKVNPGDSNKFKMKTHKMHPLMK